MRPESTINTATVDRSRARSERGALVKRARAKAAETYLDIIDADRNSQIESAAERERRARKRRKGKPPPVRGDYPEHAALRRDLARHYEQCKSASGGKYAGGRLKQYCSAVAWKIVRQGGKYGDYPSFQGAKETNTMRRDSKGRYVKRRSSRRNAEPRRRRRRAAREERRRTRASARHRVRGYTTQRRGRVVHVPAHMSRETPRRRRRSRRRGRSGNSGLQIITEMMSPRRRRSRRLRETPMMSGGGVAILGGGVILGAALANVAHRYLSGVDPSSATAPTYPTPQTGQTAISDVATYNDLAVAHNPGMVSIGVQLGISVVGFVLGWAFKAPAVKALFYGVGLGAAGHLGVQLMNAYVLEPLFSGTNTGKRMYQHEWNANARFGSGTMAGMNLHPQQHQMGPRGHMGAQGRMLPAAQPGRVPVALAQRTGAMAHAVAPANPLYGTLGQQQPALTPQVVTISPELAAQIAQQVSGSTPTAASFPTAPPAVPAPPPGQVPLSPPANVQVTMPVAPVPSAPPAPPAPPAQTGQPPMAYAGGCQPNCACARCLVSHGGDMGAPPDRYSHPLWASIFGGGRAAA